MPSTATLGTLAMLAAAAGAALLTRSLRALAGASPPRAPGDDAPDRVVELAALAICLAGWPLAYVALAARVPSTPGAVCILGVVQAGGVAARAMEAAFPLAATVALGAVLCRRGGASPRSQAWWGAAQGAAALACAGSVAAYLAHGPAASPVDCCTFLPPSAPVAGAGPGAADDGLAFFHVAVGFCIAALLRAGFYPWGARTPVSLAATGALSALAVLHDAGAAWAPRLLGRNHPCVYDLLSERPLAGLALMLLAAAPAVALLALPVTRSIPDAAERALAAACRAAAAAAAAGLAVLWIHRWVGAP